jgi:hypothetical protein
MFMSVATSWLRRCQLPESIIPVLKGAVERILEIELNRGEAETVATPAALQLHFTGGIEVLIRVLQAIGRDPKLQRTHSWGMASQGKASVFSHLIRMTAPSRDETPEQFVSAVRAAGIDEDSLIAVAFYAPQWARFIQAVIDWPLFEKAVCWFHAHTKENQWRVGFEVREQWNASIRQLTPLSLEDLLQGATDVDWFHRTYRALGEKRWARMNEFAKYASGGAGPTRAQLFAAAMLGTLKKSDLIQEIEDTRKQDAVRALGLRPLDKKRVKKDVLERYQTMQEFVRTSRQFGSQRRVSESMAARIGQENLARTAGYPDPTQLQIELIKKSERLCLAHPIDLLASKEWTAWQRDCFARQRVQPFKQIYRELYVLTDQEKTDATFSRRYAGHQVNPRQALAPLESRGWVTSPDAGVFRAFHREKLVAWM